MYGRQPARREKEERGNPVAGGLEPRMSGYSCHNHCTTSYDSNQPSQFTFHTHWWYSKLQSCTSETTHQILCTIQDTYVLNKLDCIKGYKPTEHVLNIATSVKSSVPIRSEKIIIAKNMRTYIFQFVLSASIHFQLW